MSAKSEQAGRIKLFLRGQAVYLWHVVGLVTPGMELPSNRSLSIKSLPLDGWDDADLKLMIEEGRRQLDRQLADLERIRGRAQWLFTVGAAATGILGTTLASSHPGLFLFILWLLGLALLTYGIGGAAAILVGRADFQYIFTAVLSGVELPALRSLADSYSRMLHTGEDTIATRLTVLRQAVLFSLTGGYLGLLAVLLHGPS